MNEHQHYYAERKQPDTTEDNMCDSTGMKFIYSDRKQMRFAWG